MKCLSCGMEIDGSKNSVCPVCGLEVIHFIAASDSELDELIKVESSYAKSYYDELVKDIQIEIAVYDYSASKLSDIPQGKLVEKEEMLKFEMKNLEIGKAYWLPEAFVRINRDIELKVKIIDNKKKEHMKQILLKDPQCDGDFQQLGVLLKSGLRLEILTGIEKKFSSSESIQLIAE